MTETANRVAAVREQLAELEAEALVVTQEYNRRYLTGFHGSAGIAVVTPATAHLLVDFRYITQAGHEAPDFETVRVMSRYQDTLAETLQNLGSTRVAFDAEHITVAELERWKEAMPAVSFVSTSGVIERGRAVKSAAELDTIRRAARLADEAMAHIQDWVRPGQTEAEVAWEVERFLHAQGAEGLAFPPIVAAGENGALPHHHSGSRVIRAGEPIVVDLGARVEGYHSDLTRTFSIGPAADPDYLKVYDIVAAANAAASAGIRPGVTGMAADSLARELIKAAGYGDEFGHSLGHGVGLNVHEGPRLTFVPTEVILAAGNVVTIEPGIYLPGRFGVRIEDLALIGPDGVESLSHASKSPVLPA